MGDVLATLRRISDLVGESEPFSVPERLTLASANPDKLADMEAAWRGLGIGGEIVAGLSWEDVEETGETLEENALLKARSVVAATGLPSLADDTGLEVATLGGAPGVRSARYAGENISHRDNIERLLRNMDGRTDRSAQVRTVMALAWPDGRHLTAEGAIQGRIAQAPRGNGGFGYDPVFEVGEHTLAELSTEDKHRVSQRRIALETLSTQLRIDPS